MSDNKNYIFTSESVSEGHPDKVCDGISDAILDLYLSKDAEARVAVETLTTTNKIVIAGETRSNVTISKAEIEACARQKVKKIGYAQDGFHWENLSCDVLVHEQSTEIAQGVDSGDNKAEGAGDQGIMFGYACNENDAYMPAPLYFSHKVLENIARDRHAGILKTIQPDSKSQFSVRYENGKAVGTTAIVLSTQHNDGMSQQDVRDIIMPYIIDVLPEGWLCAEKDIYINPTGKFVIGGPDGDAGLTGRKIIVDTYGGAAPHGGGAFSGKDPTKVDRSAAYATRYLAKNVVAAGLADKATIQVSYAIGISDPLSFYVTTHGTGTVDEEKLARILPQLMDLTPKGIRTHLNLNKPIYEPTSAYGHFGRVAGTDGTFTWEKTDLVEALKSAF